jgi:hypothetical protein
MELRLYAGFDSNQVICTDPAPGATNVETNYLPLIELTRASLPWIEDPILPATIRPSAERRSPPAGPP